LFFYPENSLKIEDLKKELLETKTEPLLTQNKLREEQKKNREEKV